MGMYHETGPNKCIGRHSIQNEINRIIKDEGGQNMAAHLTDPEYRESIRQRLTKMPGVEWCDYKSNTCYCN